MAKKKPAVEFSAKNVLFVLDQVEYKVILFKEEQMTVDCIIEQDNGKKKSVNLPFAHLPKNIKQVLKPKR